MSGCMVDEHQSVTVLRVSAGTAHRVSAGSVIVLPCQKTEGLWRRNAKQLGVIHAAPHQMEHHFDLPVFGELFSALQIHARYCIRKIEGNDHGGKGVGRW